MNVFDAAQMDYGYRSRTPGYPEYAHRATRDLFPTPMDAAAASQIPLLSDAAGVLADVGMYQREPETRTAGNFAMTALGVLPFIPSAWLLHQMARGGNIAADVRRLGPGGRQAGMIAGPGAETANLGMLERARQMKASGAPPDEVRQRTGWDL